MNINTAGLSPRYNSFTLEQKSQFRFCWKTCPGQARACIQSITHTEIPIVHRHLWLPLTLGHWILFPCGSVQNCKTCITVPILLEGCYVSLSTQSNYVIKAPTKCTNVK